MSLSLNTVKTIIIYKFKFWFNLGSTPDFFILGAQKSGTTSLYKYIEDNAINFKPPINKELYFFTENYKRGLRYYQALFPLKNKKMITGEATPDYLYFHLTPKRVYEMLGSQLKFIIILRDPTERAYSQYKHQNLTTKTKAHDSLSFSDAIRKEESRFIISEESNFSHEYKYYSYKSRGKYIIQINNWLRYYSKDNFLFLTLEELSKEPVITMNTVFNFLNLERKVPFKTEIFEKLNTSPRSKMLKEDKEYLDLYFEPFNKELELEHNISFKK